MRVRCEVIDLGFHLCHHFVQLCPFKHTLKFLNLFDFTTCDPAFGYFLNRDDGFNDDRFDLGPLALELLEFILNSDLISCELCLDLHLL